jgi:hypothetical protein
VNLEQLQRAVFEVTRQPLTPSEGMRFRLPDGRSTRQIAEAIIKSNDRMTSFERLQIYNQQYWFRILAALSEDFLGLRSIIGERKFEKLAIAYLNDCPSESFTLRNLGSRLEFWLRKHPEYVAGVERIALDMVQLEWADIEAFDLRALPCLTAEDASKLSGKRAIRLQPHMQLLEFAYPVDELLLRIRRPEPESNMVSNAVLEFPHRRRIRRAALPKPKRVYLVVYRLDGSVYFKRLTRDAFALLKALGQQKTLGEAIEASLNASRKGVDDFKERLQGWFENWATLGWLAKPS